MTKRLLLTVLVVFLFLVAPVTAATSTANSTNTLESTAAAANVILNEIEESGNALLAAIESGKTGAELDAAIEEFYARDAKAMAALYALYA